ncbi:MAG: amidophosphoribosyltransferase [Planctomycetes bacterium]|nr:amidophosphoribosyltransferase [Planctomycetota bacterium]
MKIREHCGVFGIWGTPDAAVRTYYGLYALQHRGQESAGIVVSDGKQVVSRKGLGLLNEAISRDDVAGLKGHLAVGHVRYSTTGSKRVQNIQPLVIEYSQGLIAVAHNGNLVNARTLHTEYERRGSIFQTSTDSEVIVHLLADPDHASRPDRIGHCLNHLKGAYSFLLMTPTQLIAARDPLGFRPLCIGKIGDAHVVASETCAFDLLGARYLGEINAGELVVIDENGLRSEQFAHAGKRSQCVFEHIYFARPDSYIFGTNVHTVRMNLGRNIAIEHPADADVVIAIPDSGRSCAMGYALASGIPLDRGFVRNHYVGRTFIMPEARDQGVDIKLNVVRPVVQGKRIVIVDDSIVRGTTSKGRIKKLRDAGAKEIHMRISCPPIRHPCFYGIDFPTTTELFAAKHSVEELRDFLKVDSLQYQSIEGLLASLGEQANHYCIACFTGQYPVRPEEKMEKLSMETHS